MLSLTLDKYKEVFVNATQQVCILVVCHVVVVYMAHCNSLTCCNGVPYVPYSWKFSRITFFTVDYYFVAFHVLIF